MTIRKIILLAVFTATMLTGCFTSSTSGGALGENRRQMFLVGEQEMNEAAAKAYVETLSGARQKGLLNIDPVMTKKVQDVAKRLIAQVGAFREDALKWKWEVNVIDENTINAWCMPGGRIVVYSGIIKNLSLTNGELAAVMGHEIAHALREHSREQASTDRLKNVGIFAVSQAAGLGDLAAGAINIAAQYTISLPFSRSHEREADHIGTELMARAGYDPKEAVNVWVKMSKKSGGSVPEILSTHPSNESRIADLREVAAKLEPVYLQAKK